MPLMEGAEPVQGIQDPIGVPDAVENQIEGRQLFSASGKGPGLQEGPGLTRELRQLYFAADSPTICLAE